MKIGLTAGVFDLFHIGHLNLLRRCKLYCDKLIVCILTDKYCKYRKDKYPIINQKDRYEIVKSIKYVDSVIYQYKDYQVIDFCKKFNVNIVFKGSDKIQDERWNFFYKTELNSIAVDLMFLDYTKSINTTKIINKIKEL